MEFNIFKDTMIIRYTPLETYLIKEGGVTWLHYMIYKLKNQISKTSGEQLDETQLKTDNHILQSQWYLFYVVLISFPLMVFILIGPV